MTGHLAVSHAVAFAERHGYALLFWWVPAKRGRDSAGLGAVAAGAIIRTGRSNGLFVVPIDLFPSRLLIAFLLAVAAVIVLLGPGAFSLGARLFGLREIIIPRTRSEG